MKKYLPRISEFVAICCNFGQYQRILGFPPRYFWCFSVIHLPKRVVVNGGESDNSSSSSSTRIEPSMLDLFFTSSMLTLKNTNKRIQTHHNTTRHKPKRFISVGCEELIAQLSKFTSRQPKYIMWQEWHWLQHSK